MDSFLLQFLLDNGEETAERSICDFYGSTWFFPFISNKNGENQISTWFCSDSFIRKDLKIAGGNQ